MIVLIVGGAGDVGRYLVKYFAEQGCEVRVLDRAPEPGSLSPFVTQYFRANILERASLEEAIRDVDTVINLAWSFSDDPRTVFGEDIQGQINLLEEAEAHGVRRLIYTSTATVYGRAIQHPVTEDHPCLIEEARKPLYALGKYVAEKLCLLYFQERGLPVTVFRFWWAFGEQIAGRHLRELVRKALSGEPLDMVAHAGGTFVTMADLAHAIRLALDSPQAAGKVYNVGSLFLTWEEIGAMIIDLAGSNSSINLVPSERWSGPAFLNEIWDLSWEKAGKELGYRPQGLPGEARAMFIQALKNCIEQVRLERR